MIKTFGLLLGLLMIFTGFYFEIHAKDNGDLVMSFILVAAGGVVFAGYLAEEP